MTQNNPPSDGYDSRYMVHSKNGKFADCQGSKHLSEFFSTQINNNKPIVLFFHGGLVSREAGIVHAKNLNTLFAHSNNLFFIWESMINETIVNNQKDLPQALITAFLGFRNIFKLKAPTYWATKIRWPLLRMVIIFLLPMLNFIFIVLSWVLSMFLPIQLILRLWYAGYRSTHALIMEDMIFPLVTGLVYWLVISMLVITIVPIINMLDIIPIETSFAKLWNYKKWWFWVGLSFSSSLYHIVARGMWETMKKDAKDSLEKGGVFLQTVNHLKKLAQKKEEGESLRIILMGHSAGSIFVLNLLEYLAKEGNEDLKKCFEVVFLAPACTFDRMNKALLTSQPNGFRGEEYLKCDCSLQAKSKTTPRLRIFLMNDNTELKDAMMQGSISKTLSRLLYPHSLLYWVSGSAERMMNTGLVGLYERYNIETYPDARHESQRLIKDWFNKHGTLSQFIVPSFCYKNTSENFGWISESTTHGDFGAHTDVSLQNTLISLISGKGWTVPRPNNSLPSYSNKLGFQIKRAIGIILILSLSIMDIVFIAKN